MVAWLGRLADGSLAETGVSFESTSDAEEWLKTAWWDLLDEGICEVELVVDGVSKYTMKLTA